MIRTRVFGSVTQRRAFASATTFEIHYAPRTVLPMHAHEAPLFLLTLEGSFHETAGTCERTCVPGRMLYRPAGQRHAQRFHDAGARCLAIEFYSDLAVTLKCADRDCEFRGQAALLAMRLYDELSTPTIDTELVVEETLVRLASVAAGPESREHEASPAWLGRVIDLID
ncbi:MAG TPA: hypothetical protein VKE42_11190, partial [Candidatus Cybelea sp.]|nr:hypothetical protein [Candidatus Cybelea sp.]